MTDPFTDAATSASEDYVRTPKMNVGTFRDRIAEAYMDAAEWARDHLAAQEPTDAEVEAAAQKLCEDRYSAHWDRMSDPMQESLRRTVRRVLTAARAVGRDAR